MFRRKRYLKVSERELQAWAQGLFAVSSVAIAEHEQAVLEFQASVELAQREILTAFREVQMFVDQIRVALEDGEDIAEALVSLGESLSDLCANIEEYVGA